MPPKDLVPKGPDWISRKVADLERQITELRSARKAQATGVSKGGITLTEDSFIRMVTDLGVEAVYFGPDDNGRQIFRLRREQDRGIFATGSAGGRDFWALFDNTNHIIMSDDATTGRGMARPWLPVVLNPRFTPTDNTADTVWQYRRIAVSALASEQTLWDGRATISHPYIMLQGTWGQATGTNSCTYRLLVGSEEVGTWSTSGAGLLLDWLGPFAISDDLINDDHVRVQIVAQGSGTGTVAAEVNEIYLRQSP